MRYFLTWLALLVLTVVSYLVTGVDLGVWSMAMALSIASVKALLVVAVFMHLLHARFVYQLSLGVAVVLIVLMIGLTAGDVVWQDVLPALTPSLD